MQSRALVHHHQMPRRPRSLDVSPDPRLSPYRNRVGQLRRGDVFVGQIFVAVVPYCLSTGGALWWRTWGDVSEAAQVYFSIRDEGGRHPAGDGDTLMTPETLDEEVADWASGVFEFNGEQLAVEWLSLEESEKIKRSYFSRDSGLA